MRRAAQLLGTRPFRTALEILRLHIEQLLPELLDFCVALFKCWKAAPQNKKRTLFVCPEMGPYHEGGAGYNISGLPPAWPDAVILRGELDKAWKRA